MVWLGSRCSRNEFVLLVSFWTVTLESYCGQTTGSQGLSFGVLLTLTKVNRHRKNQLQWS